MHEYDVLILGGGPGGYVAAIRAAHLGKKTAIVESNHLGGICLNWGCIPTKALLKNADVYEIINNANKFGIEVGEVSINWGKIIKRSRDVSKRLSKGIEFLMKKNKIDYIPAEGKLLGKGKIETTDSNGKKALATANNIIIATGARPKWFSGIKPDGKQVITYKEAMILDKQPKSLVIIGAGAIGVEFAHFFQTFGTEVTLIEALPNILPIEDNEISVELEKIFKKRKMNILTNTKVKKIEKLKTKIKVHLQGDKIVEAEKALIAMGVQGNIEDLGLEECNIAVKDGWIQKNEFMETSPIANTFF
jgi:dihydrolipoamide dehydrogenase